MNCKENESLIYVWNELTEKERTLLLNHMAECPACTLVYHETRQLHEKIELVAANKTVTENAARLTSRIMSAVHEQQSGRSVWSVIFSVQKVARYAFAALSFVLLITFGVEYLYGVDDQQHHTFEKPGEMVILNSSIIRTTPEDRKKQKSISATCRSPFIDQLTYWQCVKGRLQ